jgi:peptidoglycan/LPS O-acetylase OafA/YrhL
MGPAARATSLRAKVRAIRVPVLADRFSSRANSVGFLRLLFASAVLLSHAWGLGFGRVSTVEIWARHQWDLGGMSVYGFFVLSGFLITASATKTGVWRYLWHRCLRIYPGLWVCLLVSALVLAPIVALIEYGSTAGLWGAPDGPFQYLHANWTAAMRQYNIHNLFVHTPMARAFGNNAVDGSLWTLIYELICYLGVAALAVTGVLRRAPRMILLLTACFYVVLLRDWLHQTGRYGGPLDHGTLGPFPFAGLLFVSYLILLGFVFLLGASAYLYRDRVPIHPVLAGIAVVVVAVTTRFGGWYPFGLPAFAYLTIFAACVLPRWLHGIGRARDYSYGVYIYAWPVEDFLALLRVNRFGFVVYVAACLAGTLALAVASWHLIERPAMSLKSWSPRPRLKRSAAPVTQTAASAAAAPGEEVQPPAVPKPLSPTATSGAIVAAPAD